MVLTTHPHLSAEVKIEYGYTSTPPLGLHGLLQGEPLHRVVQKSHNLNNCRVDLPGNDVISALVAGWHVSPKYVIMGASMKPIPIPRMTLAPNSI